MLISGPKLGIWRTCSQSVLMLFLTCEQRRLNGGTDVIAPPGAQTVTPRSPSIVGPRLDQVYGVPGSFSRVEYNATIISGETYAPTPEINSNLYCKLTYGRTAP